MKIRLVLLGSMAVFPAMADPSFGGFQFTTQMPNMAVTGILGDERDPGLSRVRVVGPAEVCPEGFDRAFVINTKENAWTLCVKR